MKYTAGEVRARVNKAWQNHDEHGRVFITMGDAMALVETILPECIEAGAAKALGACPKHGVEYVGECSGCAMTLPEKDFTHPPAQAAQVEARTIRPCRVDSRDFPTGSLVQQVIGRSDACYDRFHDRPSAETLARVDDCRVCGCVHNGQCLCTKPNVVPVVQGEVCKICGKDTPHYHLRGTAPTPAPPINLAAVREVIESHINEAKNLRHDPELQDYLYEQADKLTAALQEKGNG